MKDFWLVDPGALEAERELLDTGGHGTGMKLSELVMRDKLQGVTLGDVEFFLQLHSSSGQAVPAEAAQACATAIRAKEDQGSPDKDRRIRPEEFDQWAERCTSGRFSTEVEELRRYVKDSTIERYLIEVQTSPNASAANQQSALSPDVFVEFFGDRIDQEETTDSGVDMEVGARRLPEGVAHRAAKDGHHLTVQTHQLGDVRYRTSTGPLQLKAYHRVQLPGVEDLSEQLFLPGSLEAFELQTAELGDVTACRVWLNNAQPMSWQCDTIAITSTASMRKRSFKCSKSESKGEVFTQRITGKMLWASTDGATDEPYAMPSPRTTFGLSRLLTRERHRTEAEEERLQIDLSNEVQTTHPDTPSPSSRLAKRLSGKDDAPLLEAVGAADDASCATYTVTLHTSDEHKADGHRCHPYVQLIGMLQPAEESDTAELKSGRFVRLGSSFEQHEEGKMELTRQKTVLKRGGSATFEYKSAELGELRCCRVWQDSRKASWHLDRVVVRRGDKAWVFPCNDVVKDETKPFPIALQAEPQPTDALLEMMERQKEAELEHSFIQLLISAESLFQV